MKEREDYLYPGSDVLINKGGFQDQSKLDIFEHVATSSRLKELKEEPLSNEFDFDHLKANHKHVFGDVYDWAGEPREVDMGKGGSKFLAATEIEASAERVLGELKTKDNHLKGLDEATFKDKFTDYYSELNKIHPFREGNGRALQSFMSHLAKEAGYSVDFNKVEKDEWNNAFEDSMTNPWGGNEALSNVLDKITVPERIGHIGNDKNAQNEDKALTDEAYQKLSDDQKEMLGLVYAQGKEQGLNHDEIKASMKAAITPSKEQEVEAETER